MHIGADPKVNKKLELDGVEASHTFSKKVLKTINVRGGYILKLLNVENTVENQTYPLIVCSCCSTAVAMLVDGVSL